MADGDEKIDHNDRVLVKNRVVDDKVEIPYNGVVVTWKPGELRSIQRVQAFDHFVPKSRFHVDPTGETFPCEKLVIVNEAGEATEPGATTEPLTAAQIKDIAKYGLIDTSKLPPDRLIGGEMLMDPETGQYPGGVALRGAPKGGGMAIATIPPRSGSDRADTDRALDSL